MANPLTPNRPRLIWRVWQPRSRPCCPAGPSLRPRWPPPMPCAAPLPRLAPRVASIRCSWPAAGSPAPTCPPALPLQVPRAGRCWSLWAATLASTTLPCRSPSPKPPTAWFWPPMARSKAGCRRISRPMSPPGSPTTPACRSRRRSSTRTRSLAPSPATGRGPFACRSLRPTAAMSATTSPPRCGQPGFQGRILPAIGLHPSIPALIAAAITRGVPVCAGACRWQAAGGPR